MKTGFNKLAIAVVLLTVSAPALAAATVIAAGVAFGAFSLGASVLVTAIAFVATAVVTKSFLKSLQPAIGGAGSSPNPGNRQQVPPATDNRLPVIYGQAWLGGTIIDLSISEDNQQIYFVLALAEVTNNGLDTYNFGDVYWAGKKCNFASPTSANIVSLTDESTGETDESVKDKLKIYLYRNGSNVPSRGDQSAISVMQADGLTYKWDSSKLMTNCAFAIVHITYSTEANLTGMQDTRFKLTNARSAPGQCFLDYLTNTVYGAGIPVEQVDTTSLDDLDAYCFQQFTYTSNTGATTTQTRFRFDGAIDTNRNIMDNLQDMASCCDCLLRYNEVEGKWGVIVQKPSYTIAMALNDSNITSAIQITPNDLAGSYNVCEVKFPDKSNQDSFNVVTIDLQTVAPSLLFPNEPINKQSIALPLVNNDVRAQYLANRFLKATRDDLQVSLTIDYQGIQLEAGDIVTLTSPNYGWVDKEFRLLKVTESFEGDGSLTAKLLLIEFNASVYDDVSITEFQPSPNTGIPDPLIFGAIPAPTITTQFPDAVNPLFLVNVTASNQGIIQYAEVWYSAFAAPTQSQLIFAGTTAIQSNGTPYNPGAAMPPVSLANVPSGNWYFFSRMVNSLGSSAFSPPSALFAWRPSSIQFSSKYLSIAFADDINGGGFSLNPRNKSFYGWVNQEGSTVSTNPSAYTWRLAEPTFGTNIFLLYSNQGARRFSFDTGFAGFAAGSGSFVPTQASLFDPRTWSGLQDGINIIDLDESTGQVLETGTTTVGTGEIAVVNSPDGKVVASLKQFLDFGPGVYTKTTAVGNLTIDIYGRVVGFEDPDSFYYTQESFTATSGQTVFSVTRDASYISGQCWVLQNGVLLDESEYTDTAGATGTVTLAVGATLNDIVTIISFRAENVTTGDYAAFSRNTATLTNVASYTASGFTLKSGYELLFLNGTVVNEFDYDIIEQTIAAFPNITSGLLTVIQWTPNNLGTPAGNAVNLIQVPQIGQTTYPFNFDASAFNLYTNGVLLEQTVDYTLGTGEYTLANSPTTVNDIMVQQTFARTGAA